MRLLSLALLAAVACSTVRVAPAPVASPEWQHPAPDAATRSVPPFEFMPWPLNLEAWSPTSNGFVRGEQVSFSAIVCRASEESGHPEVACTAAPELDPETRLFRDRAARCFHIAEPAPSPDLLALVTERVRSVFTQNHALRPESLGVLPLGPRDFVSVQLDQVHLVPERENGGCGNGPHRPGQPICDPVPGPPTGRMQRSQWSYRVVLGPDSGKAQTSVSPWEDLFPTEHLESYWIHIGHGKSPFAIDPALAVSYGISIPDPAEILPKLEAFPFAGPPELRAALLADIALAAFRTGDLEKGRTATHALESLVASEPVARAHLALDPTLKALGEISSGKWVVTDPCAR